MSSTFKLFADKMGGTEVVDYIGTKGEIFYNPASGSLRVSDGHTTGGNPIAIESAVEVYDEDLIPSVDNTYSLGSELLRWKEVHIGPGTLYIQDQNDAGLNAALTVVDGVLKINGANQLQVGQLKFIDNTIESETGEEDIQIGLLTSPANLVLNRNVVMGADKTFQLRDGNDNVLMQIQNEDGVGKLKFDGGSNGIWYDGGVVINGVGYHSDY